MSAYTTTMLLAAVARKSFAPANQSTYDTDDLLAMASEELESVIIPNILAAREDFFVTLKDYTITANQAAYQIPDRAFGSTLREVHLVNSSGSHRDISRIEIEEVVDDTVGAPESFYIKDDKIYLYPTPSTTNDTLRVWYYIMPGVYVAESAGAKISAIDTGTNIVTVTAVPSSWATGNTFDFISGFTSHAYRGIDFVSSLISGSDITFSSLPSDLAVGDYIALQGESPLVQAPRNYRVPLAQQIAATILSDMNQPGAQKAMEKAEKLLDIAQAVIVPRVTGEKRVLTPENWF